MATFTSVKLGDWNDGGTWGNNSPGVKGTDWPGLAGDVVNVNHVVTYNVSETNELGVVTINNGGILTFATNMNTKLTMGQVDIDIKIGGELRVGTSGAMIPKEYIAEVLWNTTVLATKGLFSNAGAGNTSGKVTICGDPDYYGSDDDTYLQADWAAPASGDSTFYAIDDMSEKWQVGQELVIHKGGAYVHTLNDLCLVNIRDTVTWDGSKSTIPVTMIHIPGGAATFKDGGDVVNVSRNVKLGKLGASINIGTYNALTPRAALGVGEGNANSDVRYSQWTGFYGIIMGNPYPSSNKLNFLGNVVRNNNLYGMQGGALCNISGVFYSNNQAFSTMSRCIISNAKIFASTIAANLCRKCQFLDSVSIFSNATGFQNIAHTVVFASLYSNLNTIYSNSMNFLTFGGKLGFDPFDRVKNNTYDIVSYGITDVLLKNAKIRSEGLVFYLRESYDWDFRVRSEHHNRGVNNQIYYEKSGTMEKVIANGENSRPNQRLGGLADVIEIIPLTSCNTYGVPVFYEPLRIWHKAGVAKTYRFYVQTTYVSLTSSIFYLTGEYLDEDTGGHLGTVTSTQNISTRSDQSDWSQYLEVIIPATVQSYWVELQIALSDYEAKKIWVDPKPTIT